MRVVFLGTPDFAVESLKEIHENSKHEIVGVVTVPDKPAGRGRKVSESAVKKYAVSRNLPLSQPDKLRDPEFIQWLESISADVFVVVAFRMLPEVVWKIPPKGTFNLHGSLLPDYRGAAPINWAIINGEKETGVTTFFINEQIDTGNLLLQEKLEIKESDNAGSIHDQLMVIGAKLVVTTLNGIENNGLIGVPQAEPKKEKEAPKLNKENCTLSIKQNETEIIQKIKGLSPYPGAMFRILEGNSEKTIKVYAAKFESKSHGHPIGSCDFNEGNWLVYSKNGVLYLNEIQYPGKKRMAASDFLRGYRPNVAPLFQ